MNYHLSNFVEKISTDIHFQKRCQKSRVPSIYNISKSRLQGVNWFRKTHPHFGPFGFSFPLFFPLRPLLFSAFLVALLTLTLTTPFFSQVFYFNIWTCFLNPQETANLSPQSRICLPAKTCNQCQNAKRTARVSLTLICLGYNCDGKRWQQASSGLNNLGIEDR